MTQTAIRRRKVEMPSGIKKKFTAALSMLLVAAIMMVGSTYAWFTLSTAPEVKGITTSIGANGNLEIALLNQASFASTANDLGIISNVGDSMENTNNWTVDQANHTWGNLVDLGKQNNVEVYGLSEVSLLPAALYVTNPGDLGEGEAYIVDAATLLKIAEYGGDGRVKSVNENTVLGLYDNGSFKQQANAFAGVRGIGKLSETSQRQLNYRSAISAANAARADANNKITTSLNQRGPDLGRLLIKVSRASNDTVFTADDIAVINNIIDDIQAANADVLEGIKQSTLAYILSAANTKDPALTDAEVNTVTSVIGAETTPDNLATIAATYGIASLPATITAAIAQYNKTNDDISNARTKLAAITPNAQGNYAFDEDFKDAIDAVVNRNNVEVNGHVPVNLTEQDKNDIADEILNSKSATIDLKENSGLYDDIAKSTGPATATITMDVAQSGLTVRDVRTTFHVIPSTPYTLVEAYNTANNAGVVGGGGAFVVTPYGYMLDFGFRTNAADGTKLRLTEAKQRVYGDSNNALTQGEGSTFTFTATENFGVEKVKKLMTGLRVVFTTPTADGFEIIAVAVAGTPAENGNEVKAPLVLKTFEFVEHTGEAPELKLTGDVGNLDLTTLNKNVAKKISVIVYLDGDIVDNSFVANAEVSMSGKLNLQFETDANLVPMENAALHTTLSASDRIKQQYNEVVSQFKPEQITAIKNSDTTDWMMYAKNAINLMEGVGNNDLTDEQIATLTGYLAPLKETTNVAAMLAWKQAWNAEHPNP